MTRIDHTGDFSMLEMHNVTKAYRTDLLHARFSPGVAKFIVLPGTGHNSISSHPLYLDILRGRI